ncbi:MAG: carboxylating nicotinate-nucleotide diphosphorylase [Candidatus Omnitrophota bacterium]
MTDLNTLEYELTQQLIQMALSEDQVTEDVTTHALLEFDRRVTASVTAKEDGILSGTGVFTDVFHHIDPGVQIRVLTPDGSVVNKGDTVLEIEGMESSILKAERTALNFLQRLSGIATLTRKFVDLLTPYGITLLDTRKTTPGMRYLEKKAVRDGGGTNHRMNLEDMAMVKDNHIAMAGSIAAAVRKIRERFPGKKIEVEVRNLRELDEALSLDVAMIMLDNFDPGLLNEAVQRRRPGQSVKFEVSGNVNLGNIEQRAAECAGIDFISVGALTHSFKSLDLSLNILNITR